MHKFMLIIEQCGFLDCFVRPISNGLSLHSSAVYRIKVSCQGAFADITLAMSILSQLRGQ